MNENIFMHQLRDAMPSDSWWRKLHGNRFQTSLPDVIAVCNCKTVFAEFKWLTRPTGTESLLETIERLLTAGQAQELRHVAAVGGNACVVIGVPIEGAVDGTLAISVDARQLASKRSWLGTMSSVPCIAEHLVHVRPPFLEDCDRQLRAQLHLRGFEWATPWLLRVEP